MTAFARRTASQPRENGVLAVLGPDFDPLAHERLRHEHVREGVNGVLALVEGRGSLRVKPRPYLKIMILDTVEPVVDAALDGLAV